MLVKRIFLNCLVHLTVAGAHLVSSGVLCQRVYKCALDKQEHEDTKYRK